ncbi:MAG: glycosyltransferase family 4 protein [Bacteroidales bacterium]|nr:glycosyltransferase family 4 protein [Bacteroidales bacterium]
MKILMTLESSFPPDKRVENEVDALLEAGHIVHIICTGDKGSSKSDIYKGAHIHRIFPASFIRKSSLAALKIPLYFIYWKSKLKKLLKEYPFDVVHIHDLPLIKPVLQLKKKYGYRIVLDLHENWPALLGISPHTRTIAGRLLCSIRGWEQYEKKYVQRADSLIAVVEEAKERLMKLEVPGDKISIVSNTLNIEEFNQSAGASKKVGGKTILIYEGGLTYHRGIQYVLQALSHLKALHNRVELWIIGKGSYMNKLNKIRKELKLESTVNFFGWLPQDKVFELVNEADVALIPHIKSEHTDTTVPHKLFHYMYAGLPVLASDCTPLVRIIKETSAGIIYRYDDTHELSGIIEKLMSNDTFVKNTGAGEWVIKKYNWKEDAIQLLKLYESLA